MKEFKYTVIFEPAEEGGWTAEIPALNHLVTQGETLDEAIEMAKDAIDGYLEVLEKKGLSIPDEEGNPGLVIRQVAVSK